ncbi:heme/copper-type cytochrome/quinol oxidase subunit 2 [Croceifilum oryzae]|uniref:Heme/copper-type cytochrome/quinol oxidase subunit 2 n=1 Tax=Croceifilum oryzae TaxID=1553429 RepID=A0AAJ1TKQ1_9BACL|nr:heme/copper-type cytochrome/quinol oxidase subunit 2 [Croceifilum oryzae]
MGYFMFGVHVVLLILFIILAYVSAKRVWYHKNPSEDYPFTAHRKTLLIVWIVILIISIFFIFGSLFVLFMDILQGYLPQYPCKDEIRKVNGCADQ